MLHRIKQINPKEFLRRIGIGILVGAFFGLLIGNVGLGMVLGFIGGILFARKRVKESGEVVGERKFKISSIKTWKMYGIMSLLVLVLLLYFFRPWFHEIVMAFYTNPAVVFMIVMAAAGAWLLAKKQKTLGGIALLLALLSLIVLSLTNVIIGSYIVQENEYNSITALPDTSQVRVIPLGVAWRYLTDSLQKSTEKVGGLDITNINNSLVWTAPRVPDGFILFLTQKVNGILIADATKTDRSTRLITKELRVGEGRGVFDNIYWKIFKTAYFINVGDIYYIQKDGGLLTIVPIIQYRLKFPVMIPYFAGVFVLDENGEISKHRPEEIKEIDYFQNNRAYPEYLARLYVDSYKYKNGIINAWFLHKDQIEISDVYGQANQQPFLMPTKDGLKWVIATEPYGESYGVFKIFLVDAVTGRIDMLELNEDQTLTGPVAVVSYVKKRFPNINWQTATVLEPRPYVINNQLYWMLSITPSDYAGISYTVFVDSTNNNVISMQTDQEIMDFVEKGVIEAHEENGDEETSESIKERTKNKINEIEKQLKELKELLEQEN